MQPEALHAHRAQVTSVVLDLMFTPERAQFKVFRIEALRRSGSHTSAYMLSRNLQG